MDIEIVAFLGVCFFIVCLVFLEIIAGYKNDIKKLEKEAIIKGYAKYNDTTLKWEWVDINEGGE